MCVFHCHVFAWVLLMWRGLFCGLCLLIIIICGGAIERGVAHFDIHNISYPLHYGLWQQDLVVSYLLVVVSCEINFLISFFGISLSSSSSSSSLAKEESRLSQ